MNDLRCVLADDEPLALELLDSLARSIKGIEITAMCRDGIEALAAIRSELPDIVFLDIEMPGLNGFDVVQRLQPESMPAIIFTTAYDQYAIDAFEVHAVDYVLKPLNPERLHIAVERAKLRLASVREMRADNKASIMSALDRIAGGRVTDGTFERPGDSHFRGTARKLLVRDEGKIHVIEPESIDWVDAAGDYMCIHVGEETLVSRTTMKKLEEQLDDRMFARIHRSTLVNVSKVLRIERLSKGDCILYLPEGVILKASRNYREHLMKVLT